MTKKLSSKNSNLHQAKREGNDEFYTQLSDIENELKHYKDHFNDKTILCNCDDPRMSNFFKYFAMNFETLGLKKLIATCYKNQNIDLFSQHKTEQAVYLIYEGDKNGNKQRDAEEIQVLPLKGDGDFRSEECIELLKQADIVVTNPPFSLFREYVAQLIEYNKKFLIIGNMNAITYKEIFPLIAKNKLWLGVTMVKKFLVSKNFKSKNIIIENGKRFAKFGNVGWFTNLKHSKRNEKIILYEKYSPEKYPKYDNYNAINVNKVDEIPYDYEGVMGVPITFLNKYNPEQFEIVAFRKGNDGKDLIYSLSRNKFISKEIGMNEEKKNSTILQNPCQTDLMMGLDQLLTESKFTEELQFSTPIAGMIKNAEGKINGAITYARILIRKK